jgi:hypothetical protein
VAGGVCVNIYGGCLSFLSLIHNILATFEARVSLHGRPVEDNFMITMQSQV